MEDERGPAPVLVPPLVVGDLCPRAVEDLWLPLGQARPHGEIGLGQVDGLVVVHGGFSFY